LFSGRVKGVFVFSKASGSAQGTNQLLMQWVLVALSLRVKGTVKEATH
jgi:hypothetical protein